jgi:hypothetical protein
MKRNLKTIKYGYFFDADYFCVYKVPQSLIEKVKLCKEDYEVNDVIEEMRKYEKILHVDYCSQIL